MKKYLLWILCLSFLIFSLAGCGMSEEQLEAYSVVDFNIIWEETEKEVRERGEIISGKDAYYQITGISTDEYIAYKHYTSMFWAENPYTPLVLAHPDRGTDFELDVSSAKLVLRGSWEGWWRNEEEDVWEAAGIRLRKQVLADMEEELAKQVAKSISAKTKYKEQQDLGKNFSYVYAYEKSGYEMERLYGNLLGMQYSLSGYESLTWTAFIVQYEDPDGRIGYAIEVWTNAYPKAHDKKYIPSIESMNVLIAEVRETYDLITYDEISTFAKVARFSFSDHLERYPKGAPGVKYDGFVNTSVSGVRNADAAVERAANECTVEWNDAQVCWDEYNEKGIWMVTFYQKDVLGGDQTVYLDENGVTLLIVYGE